MTMPTSAISYFFPKELGLSLVNHFSLTETIISCTCTFNNLALLIPMQLNSHCDMGIHQIKDSHYDPRPTNSNIYALENFRHYRGD